MKIFTYILVLSLSIITSLTPATIIINSYNLAPVTEVTQNFDTYTAATDLSTLPGWTVPTGSFITVSGGHVTSNTVSIVNVAAYNPSGFTIAANHEAEGILNATTSDNGTAHGVSVAIQADGSCYHIFCDGGGTIYLGYADASGSGSSYQGETETALVPPTGLKLKLAVTGSGTGRRVTGSYDVGAGWVTPVGFNNVDFGAGKYLDGGSAGLSGFSNAATNRVTTLTIRNQ